MDPFLLIAFWVVMAIVCAMVAASKKGTGVGFFFFIYGLFLWPIALTHALLMKPRPEPVRADGVINGKPYWRTKKGQYCAAIDGKEVSFPTIEMLSAALSGGEYKEPEPQEDELVGERLLRRVREL